MALERDEADVVVTADEGRLEGAVCPNASFSRARRALRILRTAAALFFASAFFWSNLFAIAATWPAKCVPIIPTPVTVLVRKLERGLPLFCFFFLLSKSIFLGQNNESRDLSSIHLGKRPGLVSLTVGSFASPPLWCLLRAPVVSTGGACVDAASC